MNGEGPTASVDVLLLTAADGEDVAVRSVNTGALDEWQDAEGPPRYPYKGKLRTFERPLRPLRVLHVHAPQMGTPIAIDIASTFAQHFQPMCLAMCGVCAGRTDWTNLGGVVIADRVYRYDVGQQVNDVTGGVATFKGDLFPYPLDAQWLQKAKNFRLEGKPSWLRGRPRTLRSQEEWFLRALARDGGVEHGSSEQRRRCLDWEVVVGNLRRAEEVSGLEFDRFKLTAKGKRREATLRGLNPTGVSKAPPFEVIVGPLATGSSLVQDVDIWKRLSQEGQRLVLALDMEASAIGTVAHTRGLPWFVAKGVMDFAEPNRPQGFREFAARASAEVTIQFLRTHLEPPEPKLRLLLCCMQAELEISKGVCSHLHGLGLNLHTEVHVADDAPRIGALRKAFGSTDLVLVMLGDGQFPEATVRELLAHARRGWDPDAGAPIDTVGLVVCCPTDRSKTPFGGLEVVPTSGRPISSWASLEEALERVVSDVCTLRKFASAFPECG